MKQQHFLIVGAGVAGITIAKHFIERGKRVTLIDNNKNRSSIIAAGMINPIVFRRMTKSWRVDEFLPYATQFYQELEQQLNSSFFHSITIRRMFSSQQEREFWIKKQEDPSYTNYLTAINLDDENYTAAFSPFGSGRLKGSCWVNTQEFMNKSLSWLKEHQIVLQEEFDYSQYNTADFTYKGIAYDGTIFCEGVESKNNPWFNEIPISCTKGETLKIRSEYLPEAESLNRKCFILPIGNKEFRVGATYIWNTYDAEITEEGRTDLQEKIHVLTDKPYDLLEQKAGIRPTTFDRRPFIGPHETIKGIYFFNGLGTKGYLLAPLLAKEFVDHVIDQKPLNEEVDLYRFKK